MVPVPLPVDDVLPALVDAVARRGAAVLCAPTGAGKTTRVPPALLDAGLAGDRRVVMLEPRRVAARAAARRMAQERGGRLGGEVGYQIRFDRVASGATRILVVTEGILVRMLQDDPLLDGVGTVVFDEFHERGIHADLSLAMARQVQLGPRPDLGIVVMSATMATGPVAAYLGDCPVVESVGRAHPVEIVHAPRRETRPLEAAAAAAARQALERSPGDVLVFLPGVGEIRRCASALERLAAERDLAVMPLYGDLPPDLQDAVLRPCGRRKVVLATNVAETSITIDGITAVVDTGLARVPRYDVSCGLDRLEIGRISRASAEQRAGRAGRTAPGVCLRLWTAAEERSMREREDPEIRRTDLAGPALGLLAWGERDPAVFPWFERPDRPALDRALDLLGALGARDDRGITDLGRLMAKFPVHPRLAALLVEGHRLGHPDAAAMSAAVLSERAPPGGRADAAGGAETGWFVQRARDHLAAIARRELGPAPGPTVGEREAVGRALLAAFPDRLACRRERGGDRGVMVGGRGVRLAGADAAIDSRLFVCVDLDAGPRGERAEAIVRRASAVEEDWLPAASLRTEVAVAFDRERESVVARERTLFADLPVRETVHGAPDPAEAARVLAEAAARDLRRALPLDDEGVDRFLRRVRCLAAWMPEVGLPSVDDAALASLLPSLCAGRRSFEELRRAPLLEALAGLLDHRQRRALDREAPDRMEVPSGSRIRLEYEPGKPPVLAARIQELFGLADTPRVAGGRVPVVVHLLAPNLWPQQVTDDLRSFWANTYPEVRKTLRARYPRHAWPENPWTAAPEKRPRRRGR